MQIKYGLHDEEVTPAQRMNLLLHAETLACLERPMKRYGIGNQIDVVRFALRMLNASPLLTYPVPTPRPEGRPALRPLGQVPEILVSQGA